MHIVANYESVRYIMLIYIVFACPVLCFNLFQSIPVIFIFENKIDIIVCSSTDQSIIQVQNIIELHIIKMYNLLMHFI